MAEPFIGEIRVFSFAYPPHGWLSCNGQLLPINRYQTLHSIFGTTYGGDGQTHFALPNLQGRVPVDQGQDYELSNYTMGQTGGEVSHQLTLAELAPRTHSYNADTASDAASTPVGNLFGKSLGREGFAYCAPSDATVPMAPGMVTTNSGDQPHNNQQPFLVVNFIIALQGIFPQRQ